MPYVVYTCSSYCVQNSGLQTVAFELNTMKNILGDSGELQLILRKIPHNVMSSGNLAVLPVGHLTCTATLLHFLSDTK